MRPSRLAAFNKPYIMLIGLVVISAATWMLLHDRTRQEVNVPSRPSPPPCPATPPYKAITTASPTKAAEPAALEVLPGYDLDAAVPSGAKRIVAVVSTAHDLRRLGPVLMGLKKVRTVELLTVLVDLDGNGQILRDAQSLFDVVPEVRVRPGPEGEQEADTEARVLFAMGGLLSRLKPSALLVHGEGIAALASAQVAMFQRIPLSHVGATVFALQALRLPAGQFRFVGLVPTTYFVENSQAAFELINEGVEEGLVHVVGSPAVETMAHALSAPAGDLIKGLKKQMASSPTNLLLVANFRSIQRPTLEALRDLVAKYTNLHLLLSAPLKADEVVKQVLSGTRVRLADPTTSDWAHALKMAHVLTTDQPLLLEDASAFNLPSVLLRPLYGNPSCAAALEGSALIANDAITLGQSLGRLLGDADLHARSRRPNHVYGDELASLRIAAILSGAHELGLSGDYTQVQALLGSLPSLPPSFASSLQGYPSIAHYWTQFLLRSHPLRATPSMLILGGDLAPALKGVFEPAVIAVFPSLRVFDGTSVPHPALEAMAPVFLTYTHGEAGPHMKVLAAPPSTPAEVEFILCHGCAPISKHEIVADVWTDGVCKRLALGGYLISKGITLKKVQSGSHLRDCFGRKKPTEGAFRHVQYNSTTVLATPSPFDTPAVRERTSITAIVAVWRRPQFLDRMLEALNAQSFKPREIWITSFASPREEEFKPLMAKWQSNPNSIPVHYISGSVNLAYFGRFQLGLLAKTSHTIFIDDDSIPGKRFFEYAMHTIHIPEYHGMLGVKGHVVDRPNAPNIPGVTGFHGPGHGGGFRITDIDVIGGAWILETNWTKLLFREPFYTTGTGEDYMLGYAFKKYTGKHIYVMATSPDWELCGYSADYYGISEQGDTTNDPKMPGPNKLNLRFELSNHLWFERAHYSMHYDLRAKFKQILVFLTTKQDLDFLHGFLGGSRTLGEHKFAFGLGGVTLRRTDVTSAFNIGADEPFGVRRIHPPEPDFARTTRPIDVMHDTMYGFNNLLQSQHPDLVLVPYGQDLSAPIAATLAARWLGIPVVLVSTGHLLPSPMPSAQRAALQALANSEVHSLVQFEEVVQRGFAI